MVNTAFGAPLVATVRDSSNNPMSGVTVTFTAPSAGASGAFSPPGNTAATNASGVATSGVFTANAKAGAYVVTASVAGLAASASFSLTNTPGPAASITATSGTPQTTSIGTVFASPLVATVKDSNGNPVSGATVTFSAPLSGPSGTFTGPNLAITMTSGTATPAAFMANSIVGSYIVNASVSGVSTPAAFSLTNVAGIILPIGVTVGVGESADFLVSLATPAPSGGVTIMLTSSDVSKVTVTPSIFIDAGNTTPSRRNATVTGVDFGIGDHQRVRARLYDGKSDSTVNRYPQLVAGNTRHHRDWHAIPALLLSAPAPAGGLTLTLMSSNTGVATVAPSVTVQAGSTSATVRVTGVAQGTSTITVSAPNITPATAIVIVDGGSGLL